MELKHIINGNVDKGVDDLRRIFKGVVIPTLGDLVT